MTRGYYLTHPEVLIIPSVPVTDWPLSPLGRQRVQAFAKAGWLRQITRIVCSAERKAQETAAILAGALGLAIKTDPLTGENDRTATGFLPPDAFEAAADAFFAAPDVSYLGWETARAAQTRIRAAACRIFADAGPQECILMVGHGAVGTLLRQSLRGEAISRSGDQPAGGGCLYALDPLAGRAADGWHRVEECGAAPPLPEWGLASAGRNPDFGPRHE